MNNDNDNPFGGAIYYEHNGEYVKLCDATAEWEPYELEMVTDDPKNSELVFPKLCTEAEFSVEVCY